MLACPSVGGLETDYRSHEGSSKWGELNRLDIPCKPDGIALTNKDKLCRSLSSHREEGSCRTVTPIFNCVDFSLDESIGDPTHV